MPRTLSVTMPARADQLEPLFARVDAFAAQAHLSERDAFAIHLVLDEIVVNVIRHAYDGPGDHEVDVVLSIDDEDVLEIRVEDAGRPFNPLDRPAPDLTLPAEDRPIGGLGIFLVRSHVDQMDYRREEGRNILSMRKKLSR